jgi:ribose transport system substrate-binding protein
MQWFPFRYATVFLCIALFCGCKKTKPHTEIVRQNLRIAVVPKGSTHRYWNSVEAGAKKAALEMGVDLVWRSPVNEIDTAMQIAIIDSLLNGVPGIDALVLAPNDRNALVASVEKAMKLNVPVIIIDSDIATDNYNSYVASDNYNGGAMCAKKMAELLKNNGNVIVLRYLPNSGSTGEREKGFIETLAEIAPKIKILSSDTYAGPNTQTAQRAAEDLFNAYPQANGIFCPGESITVGVFRAAEVKNLCAKIKIIGFDSNTALLSALVEEKISAILVQSPVDIGYEGVITACNVARKKAYTKISYTDQQLISKEEMKDYRMREFLDTQTDQ